MKNRFYNGQKVICVAEGAYWHYSAIYTGWGPWKKLKKCKGPTKDEIVTVIRYDNPGYIYITGYQHIGPYCDVHFMPVEEEFVQKELAKKELQEN